MIVIISIGYNGGAYESTVATEYTSLTPEQAWIRYSQGGICK